MIGTHAGDLVVVSALLGSGARSHGGFQTAIGGGAALAARRLCCLRAGGTGTPGRSCPAASPPRSNSARWRHGRCR